MRKVDKQKPLVSRAAAEAEARGDTVELLAAAVLALLLEGRPTQAPDGPETPEDRPEFPSSPDLRGFQ